MKNLFFIVAFIFSLSASAQVQFNSSLLTPKDITTLYPQALGAYYDANFQVLFDGNEYDSNNNDKSRIEFYILNCFKGEWFKSDQCDIIWFADSDGELYSLRSIMFFTRNTEGKSIRVGSEISYYPNGKIKNIINH